MRLLVGIIITAVSIVACSRSESPPPAPTKAPAAATKPLAPAFIDVRTAEEHADDHLPHATHIPLQELSSRIGEVDKLVAGDKTRPIVVFCAAGSRAAKAKAALEAAGYSNVENGGGLDDVRAQGRN